jgi:hypothetical protein
LRCAPSLPFSTLLYPSAAFWFEDPVEDEAIAAVRAAAKATEAELQRPVEPSAALRKAWPEVVAGVFRAHGIDDDAARAQAVAQGPPTVTPAKDL